jgi:hypothetical protein
MLEGTTVELIGKLSNAISNSDQRIVFSSSSTPRYVLRKRLEKT